MTSHQSTRTMAEPVIAVPFRSGNCIRTPGDCMTCMGMFGNGWLTAGPATRSIKASAPKVASLEWTKHTMTEASCVVVLGRTLLKTCGVPGVSGAIKRMPIDALGFELHETSKQVVNL